MAGEKEYKTSKLKKDRNPVNERHENNKTILSIKYMLAYIDIVIRLLLSPNSGITTKKFQSLFSPSSKKSPPVPHLPILDVQRKSLQIHARR